MGWPINEMQAEKLEAQAARYDGFDDTYAASLRQQATLARAHTSKDK